MGVAGALCCLCLLGCLLLEGRRGSPGPDWDLGDMHSAATRRQSAGMLSSVMKQTVLQGMHSAGLLMASQSKEAHAAWLSAVWMPGSAAGAAHGAARAAARHRRRPGRLGGALRRVAAVRQRARAQSSRLGRGARPRASARKRARACRVRQLRWAGGWHGANPGAAGQLRNRPGRASLAGHRRVAQQAAQGAARLCSQTPSWSLTSGTSPASLLLLL